MTQCKDSSELIDKLCQKLTTTSDGPPPPVEASGGQWCFAYSAKNKDSLMMSVTVQVTSPLAVPLNLNSELKIDDIRQLQNWLAHLFPLTK